MSALPENTETARTLAVAEALLVLLGQMRRKLREQATLGDISWSQKSVLIRLDRHGPASATALALAEGVRPQSMGATVALLEAAGLISGEPDPSDGRRTILSLTSSCREWIRTARAAREDWLFNAIQTKLDRQEQEQLAATVELLKRLVDS